MSPSQSIRLLRACLHVVLRYNNIFAYSSTLTAMPVPTETYTIKLGGVGSGNPLPISHQLDACGASISMPVPFGSRAGSDTKLCNGLALLLPLDAIRRQIEVES